MLPPYRIEFFRELGNQCDLHLVFDSLSEPGREWKVDTNYEEMSIKVLNSKGLAYDYKGGNGGLAEKRTRHLSAGLWKELNRIKPDCVVCAELGFRTILSSIWCCINKTPLIIWWEGTLHTEKRVTGIRRKMRSVLSMLATRFWSNGKASHNYLVEALGVSSDVIDNGMTGVNTHYFFKQSNELRKNLPSLKAKYNLREDPTLLFTGALSSRKGIIQLLDALDKIDISEGNSFNCLLVGDGDLRPEVEKRASKWKRINLHLTGFVQKEELCECYAVSDIYVLPTLEDNWALATLEPLLFGIPSIISTCNGAIDDLLMEDISDYVSTIEPCETESFVKAIEYRLLRFSERLPEMQVERLVDYYCPQSQSRRAFRSIENAINKS